MEKERLTIPFKISASSIELTLAWSLRDDVMTSALIGASKPEQIKENVQALENLAFTAEELTAIDSILQG